MDGTPKIILSPSNDRLFELPRICRHGQLVSVWLVGGLLSIGDTKVSSDEQGRGEGGLHGRKSVDSGSRLKGPLWHSSKEFRRAINMTTTTGNRGVASGT